MIKKLRMVAWHFNSYLLSSGVRTAANQLPPRYTKYNNYMNSHSVAQAPPESHMATEYYGVSNDLAENSHLSLST